MNDHFKPETEKQILNKSLIYSISLYVRMFVKLLGGFFIAKFLGPTLYGLRNAFDLTVTYENFSDLGTLSALNRKAPYYRGANNIKKFDMAVCTVFSVNLIYAFIAAGLLMMSALYLKHNDLDQKYVDFIFFLGLIVFTGKINTIFKTGLTIDKSFYLLSKAEVIFGITASLLGVALSYFFGFRGVLISLLIANLTSISFFLLNKRKLPPVRISFQMYWHLLKIGIPMMILFVLFLLLSSADRILIISMISEEALGYFAVSMVAVAVIAAIPHAIHNVTLAPVMEKLGRTKDKHSIKHFFTEPMVLMAYTLPLMLACIHFAIHLPIVYFLTKFLQSIKIVKILTLGFYFQAVASPALSISLAMNKQVQLIIIIAPMVGLNLLLNYLFIVSGWGINGVAIGTSITYFCHFCSIIFFTHFFLGEASKSYLKTLITIFIPFLYTMLLFWAIDSWIQFGPETLGQDILATILKIGLFTALYSLVFLKIRRHPAFQKLFRNLFFKNFSK